MKDLVVHPAPAPRPGGGARAPHVSRVPPPRAERVTLKTDSVNPTEAWRLYERLGMRKERTYETFEKPVHPGSPRG